MNSLGWYQLLNTEFKKAEETINEAIQLQPDYKYLYTNLPPALLFQGKIEEAKAQYIKWKDQPFDPGQGLPTFKEAFLDDFKTFEQADIIPDHLLPEVEAIKKLLTE
jgi:lipoprotein NlpI